MNDVEPMLFDATSPRVGRSKILRTCLSTLGLPVPSQFYDSGRWVFLPESACKSAAEILASEEVQKKTHEVRASFRSGQWLR